MGNYGLLLVVGLLALYALDKGLGKNLSPAFYTLIGQAPSASDQSGGLLPPTMTQQAPGQVYTFPLSALYAGGGVGGGY